MSILLAVAIGIAAFGQLEESIVIPRDEKPFTVSMQETVRISAQGMAGSTIEFKIQGPARLVRTNNISERAMGHSVVGVSKQEAEIKPNGTGEVTVTATVKPPNGGGGKVIVRQFTVQ